MRTTIFPVFCSFIQRFKEVLSLRQGRGSEADTHYPSARSLHKQGVWMIPSNSTSSRASVLNCSLNWPAAIWANPWINSSNWRFTLTISSALDENLVSRRLPPHNCKWSPVNKRGSRNRKKCIVQSFYLLPRESYC